jgi:hypothetical protein
MKKWIPILLAVCLIFSLTTSMAACQRKGDKGDTGAMGPQGIQGPKGDKGDPGSPAVIDIIVNETLENGASPEVPFLANGMPIIKNGYRVNIYGAGFVVGETVTFTIADANHSFSIGSTKVINSAGVFVWDTSANWPSYTWANSGHYYGFIKAVGDKGSTALSFVNIGQE